MARSGFRRNSKAISQILKTVDGGKRAAAAKILAEMNDPEAFIEVYVTDREVVGIKVPADTQAKHGTATRAAQRSAG